MKESKVKKIQRKERNEEYGRKKKWKDPSSRARSIKKGKWIKYEKKQRKIEKKKRKEERHRK